MTSFYMELNRNRNTTSIIDAGMRICKVSRFFSFGLRRYCESKNGGKNMPPSGWWVARRPSGRRVKTLNTYCRLGTLDHLGNSGLVFLSLRSRPVSRYYIPQPRVLLYVCVRMCVTLYSLEPIWHWAIWRRLRHSPVTCHIVRVGVDGTHHEHGPHFSRPMSTARGTSFADRHPMADQASKRSGCRRRLAQSCTKSTSDNAGSRPTRWLFWPSGGG